MILRPLNTPEKLALFRRFFTGLRKVYGTYDPASGHVRQVKAPVTDRVLLDHLRGIQPYGVYLLFGNRTRAIAVDFDHQDLNTPVIFVETAQHYGLSAYIERSKSKGHHVWMFFPEQGVIARKARRVVQHILSEIQHPLTEVFPKQDVLDKVSYGNFINAPLFARLVPQDRCVFMNPADPTKPCSNQWTFLRGIQIVTPATLDEIIVINDLDPADAPALPANINLSGKSSLGLAPCLQRILAEGVQDNQRVACFRVAVGLRKAGIPQDLAVETLKAWAGKNQPQPPKQVIGNEEIRSQVSGAYMKKYRGLGCEDPAIAVFCDPDCPVRTAPRNPDQAPAGGEG